MGERLDTLRDETGAGGARPGHVTADFLQQLRPARSHPRHPCRKRFLNPTHHELTTATARTLRAPSRSATVAGARGVAVSGPCPGEEGWPSGLRRTPGERVHRKVSWVRIPPPPPVAPPEPLSARRRGRKIRVISKTFSSAPGYQPSRQIAQNVLSLAPFSAGWELRQFSTRFTFPTLSRICEAAERVPFRTPSWHAKGSANALMCARPDNREISLLFLSMPG